MKIRVKYLADIEPLKKISKGDWIDLRCAEDVVMKKGEYRLIPLGVAIDLPGGCEALVVPRSSTFKNYHIMMTNSIGVIDNSYCGDTDQWYFPAYATEDTEIKKNDRICQFRVFENQYPLEFETVKTLGNNDRGGFGSSGRD